jgi:hypothetical protein
LCGNNKKYGNEYFLNISKLFFKKKKLIFTLTYQNNTKIKKKIKKKFKTYGNEFQTSCWSRSFPSRRFLFWEGDDFPLFSPFPFLFNDGINQSKTLKAQCSWVACI